MVAITVPIKAKEIMHKLKDNGHESFIVGGWVRDTLLGVKPHDVDIFTDATGNQILSIFPEGTIIGGEERQAKILTVIVDGIEVSQYRQSGDRTQTGKSLIKHLSTCDFTICSIAMDMNGKFKDPNYGNTDIENQEFGFVGEPKDRIEEDPLRILRAIRFIAKLGFNFRHRGVFKEYGHLIGNLPKERIREEFLKIIEYNGGLELLISTGLISHILPKFLENVGVNGGQHHNETVDAHILYAFNKAREISDNKLLWIAALLHDIAKGETYSLDVYKSVPGINEDGTDTSDELIKTDVHFFGHEDVGAEYAKKWMTELGFSSSDIQFVYCLVKNHMWQFNDTHTKRSFITHFREFEDKGVGILNYVYLKYCDHQGNQLNPRVKLGDFLLNSPLIKKYYELKFTREPFKVQDLVVSGKDILDLGYKPSPMVGAILKELFDHVLDGVLVNERPQLMNYLRENYEGRTNNN